MKVIVRCGDCGCNLGTFHLQGREQEVEVHKCLHDKGCRKKKAADTPAPACTEIAPGIITNHSKR